MMKDDKLLEMIGINKESAYMFRERRHDEWKENYSLFRDKVITNRLTQRQSVNVPLMKSAIKTILKDVDDPPMLYFYNRDNDTQKEVFYNEYWKHCSGESKLIVKDIVDKKQVMLFGRSFKKLNIRTGRFDFEIVDPQDMLVDRFVDPARLDSARFLAQIHIFKPLTSLSLNPLYDKAAIKRLQKYFATKQGLIASSENAQALQEKNERLGQLGVTDIDNPQVGEAYPELTENMVTIFDEKLERDVIYFVVTAEDTEILVNKPLHELIGKTEDDYWMDHTNFVSWGDDVERTDFWSDGVADTIRTPNKILNSWMSQLVENRTLRNFGMHYYDSSTESFVPQTFDPVAWGWYPVPGNPNEIVKKVDIPDLSDSLDEIQFVLTMAEKATAATATQQGEVQPQNVTLGEVQLALANAKERVKSMAALYTDSWIEFGTKYVKLLEAAGDMIDAVKIYRSGKNTKHIYSKELTPEDWQSKSGYQCEVRDLSQSQSQGTDMLQKLNVAKNAMPNNVPLAEIYKQKILEFAELNAIEVKEVMDAEKQMLMTPNPMVTNNLAGGTAGAGMVAPPQGQAPVAPMA